MMVKVNVLMSTYCGDHFLREQITSILAQKGVDVELTVRDDGSSDNTCEILEEFGNKKYLSWYKGNNLGPAHSFLYLLKQSMNADYYAFSDQDDFWESDKLKVAVDMLDEFEDVPALYFSRTQLTNSQLVPTSVVQINPYLTFGESLVYEFVPGCTMVMNKKLRNIINRYTPGYLPMHDVWIYSVALAVGSKVCFDTMPHILYRQHERNTIGQGYSAWHEWARRYKRLVHSEHSRYRRALEIKKGYNDLMPFENQSVLDAFIAAKQSLGKRIKMCMDSRYMCADKTTQNLFRLSLLMNIY